MLIIPVAVFLTVFAVICGFLLAGSSGELRQAHQTVRRLNSLVGITQATEPEEVFEIKRQDALSSIPWLDRILAKLDLFAQLRLLLDQADMKGTVGALLLSSLLCGAGGTYLVYWRTSTWPLALAVGAAAGMVPLVYVLRKREKRLQAFERKLPEALELMVSALRVGHSFNSATGMVSREMPDPIGKEFRKCFDEQTYGLELRTVLSNLAIRVPSQSIRVIAAAVLIQKETGGNLVEVLEKTATVLREKFRLQRQVRVHTAQGRLTGWILALLPAGLGLALLMLNPEHIKVLLDRPIGKQMLYTAAGMTAIGALFIRRIIRIDI